MDYYMAEVVMFAFDWAPANFASCNGSTLPINQFAALYSLLGTKFGGDGRVTFGLPDLRGRLSVGMGQGSGLTPRNFADKIGAEQVTLNANTLPSHQHAVQEKTAGQTVTATAAATVNALAGQANKLPPTNNYWGRGFTGTAATQNYADSHDTTMAADAVQVSVTPTFNASNVVITPTGASLPFAIMQPSLVLNYCICTQGLFPSRP